MKNLASVLWRWAVYPNFAQTKSDLAEFQSTPVEHLAGRAVTIGPTRTWISLLVCPAIGILFGFGLGGKAGGTVLWFWMFLGGCLGFVLAIHIMIQWQAALSLDQHGLKLSSGRKTVFIPWRAIRPDRGWHPNGLQIHIAADPLYYDGITLSIDQIATASGPTVQTAAFRVLPMSQIAIQSQFACPQEMLTRAIIENASRFHQYEPKSWAHTSEGGLLCVRQAEADVRDALVSIDERDRLVIGRANLSFPQLCYRCLQTPTTVLDDPPLEPAVPACQHCLRHAQNKISHGYWQLTGLSFLVVGLLFSVIFSFLFRWETAIVVGSVIAVLFLLKSRAAIRPFASWYFSPVSVKTANGNATLILSFENKEFTNACVQHIVRLHGGT